MLAAAEQRVFAPETMSELLNLLKQHPDSTICAGSTYLATNPFARLELRNSDIVSLTRIEELKRTMVTDRFFEFGSMVSLERILHLEQRLIPQGLRNAIIRTVPFPARSLATIGGNLCIATEMLTLLPFFAAWDSRLELRRLGVSRYVQAKDFLSPWGELNLEAGEILVRIRLPTLQWNHQVYERIDGEEAHGIPSMAFIGLARINRMSLEEVRLSWAFSNHRHHFSPALDARFAGMKLPLGDREIEAYLEEAMKQLQEVLSQETGQIRPRMEGVARRFLRHLHHQAGT